jgi:Bacterial protein of unknown function (DUF885)
MLTIARAQGFADLAAFRGSLKTNKLGQLKLRELRDRASKELAPNFDIRALHDEMLSGAVLPLDLLESRTDSWIRAQKLAFKATAAN